MATPDRPSFIAHWREIERPDDQHYDGDDELMSIGAPLSCVAEGRVEPVSI